MQAPRPPGAGLVLPQFAILAADGTPPSTRIAFDPQRHHVLPAASVCTPENEQEVSRREPTASRPAAARDGRGKYDRSGDKGRKIAWLPHVQAHMKSIEKGDLSAIVASAACAIDCAHGGKCVERVASIRVLKQCAAESFGEAALLGQWEQLTQAHTANRQWFDLALSGRLVDDQGVVTTVLYRVGDQLVCAPAWGAMRGVKPTTCATIDRLVRAGEMTWNDGTARELANANRTLKAPLKQVRSDQIRSDQVR